MKIMYMGVDSEEYVAKNLGSHEEALAKARQFLEKTPCSIYDTAYHFKRKPTDDEDELAPLLFGENNNDNNN